MTYKSEVLADTPIHYWRSGNGGIWHDISTSPTQPVHLICDPQISHFIFTGVNSDATSWLHQDSFFVSCAIPTSGGVPLTIECWIWWAQPNTATRATIFGWDGVAAGPNLAMDSASKKLRLGMAGASLLSTNVVSYQAWHHVVATVSSGGTISLYVDNAVAGTVGGASTSGWTQRLNVGLDGPGGANPFYGFITELAIYGSVLSTGRIAAHFAAADSIVSPPSYAGTVQVSTLTANPDNTALLDRIISAVTYTAY